jgi:hypothetical protein
MDSNRSQAGNSRRRSEVELRGFGGPCACPSPAEHLVPRAWFFHIDSVHTHRFPPDRVAVVTIPRSGPERRQVKSSTIRLRPKGQLGALGTFLMCPTKQAK